MKLIHIKSCSLTTLVLYLADFNLVACTFVKFHLIVILKQNVNVSFNIYSLILTVVSVETLEELK